MKPPTKPEDFNLYSYLYQWKDDCHMWWSQVLNLQTVPAWCFGAFPNPTTYFNQLAKHLMVVSFSSYPTSSTIQLDLTNLTWTVTPPYKERTTDPLSVYTACPIQNSYTLQILNLSPYLYHILNWSLPITNQHDFFPPQNVGEIPQPRWFRSPCFPKPVASRLDLSNALGTLKGRFLGSLGCRTHGLKPGSGGLPGTRFTSKTVGLTDNGDGGVGVMVVYILKISEDIWCTMNIPLDPKTHENLEGFKPPKYG